MNAYRDELLRALRIDPEDLEANRAGVLGERQKSKLTRSASRSVVVWPALMLALAALVYAVSDEMKPIQWILLGLFLAGGVIGGSLFGRRLRGAAEGGVVWLRGPIQLHATPRAGMYLTVDGRTFRPPVRPQHLKSGAPYHVFVTTGANVIVGMEPDGWA